MQGGALTARGINVRPHQNMAEDVDRAWSFHQATVAKKETLELDDTSRGVKTLYMILLLYKCDLTLLHNYSNFHTEDKWSL